MKEGRYTVAEFLLTYGSWRGLSQRCSAGSKRQDRRFYADRGVTVCERWKSFGNFIEDLGPRPSKGHSLDRFPDRAGNYEPGNCRWATAKEQANNTSRTRFLTFAGETLSVSEWTRRLGFTRGVITARLDGGMSVEQALTALEVPRKSFSTGLIAGKKLTGVQVLQVVDLAKKGRTATSLGKDFGVSGAAVCHILRQFKVRLKKGRPRCV